MKSMVLILCWLYLPMTWATDFGVFGKTYVIAEMDFLEYIEQKMKVMQANGEWTNVQQEFKKRVEAHVIRPTPHPLPRATENRTWLFNPSITVPYDVRDNAGRVIVQKGMVVNPLDRVGLSSTLLLFDFDDQAQVEWVANEVTQHNRVKLILTAGSVKDAANHFKQAVYFDLNGFLALKFQIKALPAEVKQAQNRLEVKEVAL